MNIIGREKELYELRRYYDSGRPELVVVYGRRRVGKTYLIKECFKNDFAFYFTGAIDSTNRANLLNFDSAILKYGGESALASKNWYDAFGKLECLLAKTSGARKVVFVDEMPWLDVERSDFLPAFDYFWNSYASAIPEILFICCGSATSWITKKLFKNRGGLHNRVTGRIYLAPFSLGECEAFLRSRNIEATRMQVTETYMVFGGIPYYLNLFDKGLSCSQNVDKLCFAEMAPLRNEFEELYRSLFDNPEKHIKIVEALAAKRAGMTRKEIIETTGLPSNGHLTNALNELEHSGFIERYSDFTKPKKDAYYFLKDLFTLFYLRHMKDNKSRDEYYWTNYFGDGGYKAYCGFAFELASRIHIKQIKNKLGILGVSTKTMSWRSKESKPGAQIDLLISRKDGVINICEMKFLNHPYVIGKAEAEELERKRMVFRTETKADNALHITMVTTYGVERKGYSSMMHSEVTMNDLFSLV